MHPPASPASLPSRSLRRSLCALALSLCALVAGQFAAVAQPTTGQTGTIEGRVYNAASGAYLNNARVSVEGTVFQTYTDDTGSYRLRGVPSGAVRIRVSYSGQADVEQSVTVRGDDVIVANVTFNADRSTSESGAIALDRFAVEESRFRNAQELSINEERSSLNIKSVVALDSLGYVTDGNIGEFVKFLPGVDVSYGGTNSNPDNATAVAVRGFGADSTAVLVDGVPIASGSPSGLTRTVQLDGISINNASRLEIIKVATPDMPQDAPGGTINLVTRGAFELARATYNLSVAFNGNTNNPDHFGRTPGPYEARYKTLPNVRFSASIPLTEKLGLSASVATDNKYSLVRSSNMRDWFLTNRTVTINGVTSQVANANGGIRIDNPVIDRFELNESQWVENRLSGSLRLDWKPVRGLEIRASGQVSTMENIGINRRTQWRYNNASGIQDWGADYVQGRQRTATFNPNVRGDMTIDARDKEGFTAQGTLSFKYNRGPWLIEGRYSKSESYHASPDRKNGHFSTIDVTINPGRMDLTGIDEGVVGAIKLWDNAGNPLDYGRLSAWNGFTATNGSARSSESNNRDNIDEYKLDVQRELDFLPFPVTLKTGFLSKEKFNRKWGAGGTYRMTYVGPVVPNADLESAFFSEPQNGYAMPQYWADPSKIYDLYRKNPQHFDDQLFSPTLNIDNRAWNYASRVGNTKGLSITDSDVYGMATMRFFENRLQVVTGARQSRKDTKGYNVFNDPQFNYVKMPDGTIYRDNVYTNGIKYDGSNNNYIAGDPRRDPNAIMTDTALRARMLAAGVKYLPTQVERAPNGVDNGNRENNLHFAPLGRYTRHVDSSLTQPWTPQVQLAYEITPSIRLQVAWSKETRLPDLEGGNGILVDGANFQINEAAEPVFGVPGGDGNIRISNVRGDPEINQSYNAKLSYYPKNGAGRYSISYYHKIVKNAWETNTYFNTDAEYDQYLGSMGVDRESYPNYSITTALPTGMEQIRKGFEIEISQNMGIFGPWARGVDAFVTYTRRPVTASSGGESRLGWIPLVPVRAKWTGGLSYSTRRFSAQARFTYVESGITYSGSGTAVTMPDGTAGVVQYYNLNKNRPDLNLQANYVLTRHFTLFANANRVLTESTYGRVGDELTGLQPEYASWRTKQNRGISFAAGVNASF